MFADSPEEEFPARSLEFSPAPDAKALLGTPLDERAMHRRCLLISRRYLWPVRKEKGRPFVMMIHLAADCDREEWITELGAMGGS